PAITTPRLISIGSPRTAMACAAAARSSLLNASRAASAAARRSDFCEGFDIAPVMAGLVPACPGHPRLTFSDAKDVDTRDIGAKQSFVASPGHDEGGKMRTKNKKVRSRDGRWSTRSRSSLRK